MAYSKAKLKRSGDKNHLLISDHSEEEYIRHISSYADFNVGFV
jgi:hypothetical protein